MSAPDMVEVQGVLYTPEDAKRLKLEADPLPPVGEKQVVVEKQAQPRNKSRSASTKEA
jgi:hypothetical protein